MKYKLLASLAAAALTLAAGQAGMNAQDNSGIIYFESAGGIYSFDLATGQKIFLVEGMLPDVAPDGTLAFNRYSEQAGVQIFLLENGIERQLTPCIAINSDPCSRSVWYAPAWSWDGSRLVAVKGYTFQDPMYPGSISLAGDSLAVINRQGEASVVLDTTAFADDYRECSVTNPVWLPDDAGIAFARGCRTHRDICILSFENSKVECLSDQYVENYPTFNADGVMAFVSNRDYLDDKVEWEGRQLYIMDTDKTVSKISTPELFKESLGGNCTEVSHPGWSPQGDKVVIGCQGRIYIVDIVSREATYVASGKGPVWARN